MSNVLRDLRDLRDLCDLRDLRSSLKQSVKSADGRCNGMMRRIKTCKYVDYL